MYSFQSRVRYSEVDSEQLLKLPSLLDYLQDCCTLESEDLGVGVDYLAEHHAAWVLSSWQIEIERYPKMGEQITVSTWPYDFKGFYGFRNFRVEDAQGKTIAYANSLWVYMDTEKMRPVKIADRMVEVYVPEMREAIEADWKERKIEIPASGEAQDAVVVQRFHIDTNHHMNNGKYVLAAEEFLPEGFAVKELRVEYKKAAVLGDVLYPFVTVEETSVTVALKDAQGTPYAVIWFSGEQKGRKDETL